MTEELFRNNSYIQDCEAKIIDIIDEGIILDKTIFYPEGGGQPGDNGQFKFNGKNFEITSTSYKDKKIVILIIIENMTQCQLCKPLFNGSPPL